MTRAGGGVGVAQRRGKARGTPRGDLKWSRNDYKEKYFFTVLDEIPSLALHRKSLPNRPDRLKYRRPKVTQNPDDLFFDLSATKEVVLQLYCSDFGVPWCSNKYFEHSGSIKHRIRAVAQSYLGDLVQGKFLLRRFKDHRCSPPKIRP